MCIGTDIIEIERIEKSIKRESFLKKVYSERERALIEKKGAKSAAANFAAKEAFSKALGTGVRGFEMKEVELFRDEIGKPYYSFSGKANEIVTANNLKSFASVTDEEDIVVVFTVLEII